MTELIINTYAHSSDERPKARDWFWHPWYAKLWWSLIFFSLVLSFILPRDFLMAHERAMWFVMVIVLNPYLVILGLGFGYFRAAWKYKYGLMVACSDEKGLESYCEGQVLRHGNIPTNPADPYWHWHPANPRSFHQRQRRTEAMFGKR